MGMGFICCHSWRQSRRAIWHSTCFGQKVKVIGGSPFPEKENAAIIAGSSSSRKTEEIKPVAIQVDEETLIVNSTRKRVSPTLLRNVEEGTELARPGYFSFSCEQPQRRRPSSSPSSAASSSAFCWLVFRVFSQVSRLLAIGGIERVKVGGIGGGDSRGVDLQHILIVGFGVL